MARILVIDDEVAIMMLLKRILSGSGHEVLTAVDGGQAATLVQSQKFDLILSDLSMPGAPSGLELLSEIRKAQPECPLAVVSGYSSGDTIDACHQMGIVEFLPKPFELGFVRSFVDNILKRYPSSVPAHS
jgi:DNA-binding NtrC family response regulator